MLTLFLAMSGTSSVVHKHNQVKWKIIHGFNRQLHQNIVRWI